MTHHPDDTDYQAPKDPTVEERFAALKQTVEEQGGDLHLSVTVGKIDVTKLYEITPLTKENVSLSESMDIVERLIADPRYQEVVRVTELLKESDTTLGMAKEVHDRLIEEYTLGIAAFREFAIGRGLPSEAAHRETLQSIIAQMVEEFADKVADSQPIVAPEPDPEA